MTQNSSSNVTRSIIPWTIVLLMSIYVFSLTYHAKNRPPPNPAYDFYDTTVVNVYIFDFLELPDVYGRYNNIVEGERQLVEAIPDNVGYYRLAFKVNSPRPALLYIDDEAIEIFLVPDSSLSISVFFNTTTRLPDSVKFEGYTARICEYYQQKAKKYSEVQAHLSRNTLKSEDFSTFSQRLDELALEATNFLSAYDMSNKLPNWFFNFERSEILYQKAYLKLSNAYNRQISQRYLDEIEINNEDAVFSYYYYLYLKSYISVQEMKSSQTLSRNKDQKDQVFIRQMTIGDTLLVGEMHDVFLTRMIFNQLKQNRLEMAEKMLKKYQGKFNRKKYERFLLAQYKARLVLQ